MNNTFKFGLWLGAGLTTGAMLSVGLARGLAQALSWIGLI